MLIPLLVFLIVPTSIALKCLTDDASRTKFVEETCTNDTEYCYSFDFILSNMAYTRKGCGKCKREGYRNYPSGLDYCCKGDLCNERGPHKCFVGDGLDMNPDDLYPPRKCPDGAENYCYTTNLTVNGVWRVEKGCGFGVCSHEGCKEVEGGKRCCCKGELCNTLISGKCYEDFNDSYAISNECANKGELFCHTQTTTKNGIQTVSRSCGAYYCQSEGCRKVDGDRMECCCKGELCNASGPKCYVGNGLGASPYSPTECLNGVENYCSTTNITIKGELRVEKACGFGVCSSEGCVEVDGGQRCCCKGELCNGPRNGTCHVGENGNYTSDNCEYEGELYCYTRDTTINGVRTVAKSCGASNCQSNDCSEVTGGTQCCCKGELCNAAAGSSILMTTLAAAAAVLMLK